MDAKTILDKMEKGSSICSSGINKSLYLNIIERVIDLYTPEYLWRMAQGEIDFVICIGLRAAGAISYLQSEERRPELYDLWLALMQKSCDQFSIVYDHAEYDLAVKEVMIGFKLMKNKIPEGDYIALFQKLKSIDPHKTYHCIMGKNHDESKLCNMTVYNAAGEYLRETEDMTDIKAYFDEHMPWAVGRFDQNGMWECNDQAMLYDLTTRCQFSVMMHYGYEGPYKKAIDEGLSKGGMMTLLMQSAAFQLPYGGRSNQYLFNEALVASCCEYEATRYMKAGRPVLAGMFKRCAHKSAQTVYQRLMESDTPNHIKNYFDASEAFGIDGYGTFHRYLITVAVFIGYGFLFADESVQEHACPCEIGGYVLETSDRFHKVFANCVGQSVEIETGADQRYDSTGLGRYHKAGFPIDLALSLPMTAHPKYRLPGELVRKNVSICSGVRCKDGRTVRISDLENNLKTLTNVIREDELSVRFTIEYRSGDEGRQLHIKEEYTIQKEGVFIEANCYNEDVASMVFTVPLFVTNGKDSSNIMISDSEKIVTVSIGAYQYLAQSDGSAVIHTEKTANRNGIYRTVDYEKPGKYIKVHLCMQ